MANTYKLDIVVNAYKYLNQRKIIKKYYLDPDKHEVVKVYTDGRGDLYLK